jgi:hypothetical protein
MATQPVTPTNLVAAVVASLPEQFAEGSEAKRQSAEAFVIVEPPIESGQIAQIPQIPAERYPLTKLQETVEDMTDERLDRYIVGHYTGLKKNLIAVAEGLAEKKSRLARQGCVGKWSGYVKYHVGMSISWADRLVRNWNRYHQLGARVRGAAEQAGVNINKPAVKTLLQSYNDESLLSGEPSEIRFERWVKDLRTAAKRQQNSPVAEDDPDDEGNAGDSEPEDADKPEPDEDDDGEVSGDGSASTGKIVSLRFTAQQAEEFDELIADLKTQMRTEDRPNIVLHSLRLVKDLKLEQKDA